MRDIALKKKHRKLYNVLVRIYTCPLYYYLWEPYFVRKRTNPQYAAIVSFVEKCALRVEKGALVLDAGAGICPYKKFFSHARYQSTDLTDPHGIHDFAGDLLSIPRPDDTYDAVICTEVLEHVSDPYALVRSFYRVLKPGGALFLTVPLTARYHGSPYHYFNYAKPGLELIFRQSGFEVLSIDPQNGIFKFLGNLLKHLPLEILGQYVRRPLLYLPLLVIFIVLAPVMMYLIPFLLYYLDSLDREKNYTFGYNCVCRKPFSMSAA